jgi:hypothetical protein
MDGQMDRWTYGQIDRWTDERTDIKLLSMSSHVVDFINTLSLNAQF